MSKQAPARTEILLERFEFIKADAQRTQRVMEFLLRGLSTESTAETVIPADIHNRGVSEDGGCPEHKEK